MSNAPPSRKPPSDGDPVIGATIAGKYHVLSLLAAGGMGRVYRAEQRPLGRIVALKLLHVTDAGTAGSGSDADVSEKRFYREAAILAKMQHPNIVTLFDFGVVDESIAKDARRPNDRSFFMAMEFLQGKTLQELLNEHPRLTPDESIRIGRQIARGLREAHALGVVHRDLKPLNVMITRDRDGEEIVKILDFGIVKVVEGEKAPAITMSGKAGPAQELTQEGLFVGSPHYMAPEQIETGKVDPRSDIYSFGVVLYRCLAGASPFVGAGTSMQILMAHVRDAPVPLRDRVPNVPAWLERLVHRCLEKDPARRPQSMDEVYRQLGSMTEDEIDVRPSLVGEGTVPSGERNAFLEARGAPRSQSAAGPPSAAFSSVAMPPNAPAPMTVPKLPVSDGLAPNGEAQATFGATSIHAMPRSERPKKRAALWLIPVFLASAAAVALVIVLRPPSPPPAHDAPSSSTEEIESAGPSSDGSPATAPTRTAPAQPTDTPVPTPIPTVSVPASTASATTTTPATTTAPKPYHPNVPIKPTPSTKPVTTSTLDIKLTR